MPFLRLGVGRGAGGCRTHYTQLRHGLKYGLLGTLCPKGPGRRAPCTPKNISPVTFPKGHWGMAVRLPAASETRCHVT